MRPATVPKSGRFFCAEERDLRPLLTHTLRNDSQRDGREEPSASQICNHGCRGSLGAGAP